MPGRRVPQPRCLLTPRGTWAGAAMRPVHRGDPEAWRRGRHVQRRPEARAGRSGPNARLPARPGAPCTRVPTARGWALPPEAVTSVLGRDLWVGLWASGTEQRSHWETHMGDLLPGVGLRGRGVRGGEAEASPPGSGPPKAGLLSREDSQGLESGSSYCLELSHSCNTKKIRKSLNV